MDCVVSSSDSLHSPDGARPRPRCESNSVNARPGTLLKERIEPDTISRQLGDPSTRSAITRSSIAPEKRDDPDDIGDKPDYPDDISDPTELEDPDASDTGGVGVVILHQAISTFRLQSDDIGVTLLSPQNRTAMLAVVGDLLAHKSIEGFRPSFAVSSGHCGGR